MLLAVLPAKTCCDLGLLARDIKSQRVRLHFAGRRKPARYSVGQLMGNMGDRLQSRPTCRATAAAKRVLSRAPGVGQAYLNSFLMTVFGAAEFATALLDSGGADGEDSVQGKLDAVWRRPPQGSTGSLLPGQSDLEQPAGKAEQTECAAKSI